MKKQCNHPKTILATGTAQDFYPDQEPFTAGRIEDAGIDRVDAAVPVFIHWCPDCKELVSAWIEAERNWCAEVAELRAALQELTQMADPAMNMSDAPLLEALSRARGVLQDD